MMLKQVQDPKERGVKLTPTDSEIVITKSGWKIKNFQGDDGHEYECATKKGRSDRWYQVSTLTT